MKPWRWELNPRVKDARLVSAGGDLVLDFVRWGMTGAQPRVNVDGLMRPMIDLAWPVMGREHVVKHPHAQLIEHAPVLFDAAQRLLVEGRNRNSEEAWAELNNAVLRAIGVAGGPS